MNSVPLLFFGGNCKEAIDFYKEFINVKVTDEWEIPYALVADEVLKESWGKDGQDSQGKIFYTQLTFGNGKNNSIALADSVRQKDQFHRSLSIELASDDVSVAEKWFNKLCKDGVVDMEWGKTFWAEGFGIVRDRFEFRWRIRGPLIDPADWDKGA